VAAQRRPLPIDQLLRPRDRRREADAVLGAGHVVVHRLRDRDERHPAVHQDAREGQRVVATDRDERVDPEVVDVVEHDLGQVESIVGRSVALRGLGGEPRRQGALLHPRWIGPGGVEDRSARSIDRPRRLTVEGPEVLGVEPIAGLQVRQALPAAPDADDLHAQLGRAVGDALDDRVESRHVAAAGQHADSSRTRHTNQMVATGRV
jgi:hypothetical protein